MSRFPSSQIFTGFHGLPGLRNLWKPKCIFTDAIPTSGLCHIIAFKCSLGIVSVVSGRQGLIGRSCYPFLHFCCTTLKLLHYLFDCRNHFCILLVLFLPCPPNYIKKLLCNLQSFNHCCIHSMQQSRSF